MMHVGLQNKNYIWFFKFVFYTLLPGSNVPLYMIGMPFF